VAGPHAQDVLAAVTALASRATDAGPTAGVPLCVAGALALTVAARRRRPLAVVGLAGLGVISAVLLRGPVSLHLGLSAGPAAVALAACGAIAGALYPPIFPFAAAALVGAVAGWWVPLGGRSALGAAAAALVAGLLGLALARIVTAAAASLAGGFLLALGLLASFAGRPLARELAGRPVAILGFALVAGIAGAAFQLTSPRSPNPREGRGARSPGSPPEATPGAGR
jgi:hypothetical protein